VTEGMGETDRTWDGEGKGMERRKGERDERGYSPQTSIPGAAAGRCLSVCRVLVLCK